MSGSLGPGMRLTQMRIFALPAFCTTTRVTSKIGLSELAISGVVPWPLFRAIFQYSNLRYSASSSVVDPATGRSLARRNRACPKPPTFGCP
ncbi:hypothetical protein D3C73_849610 [compost metagenome]